MSKDKGSKSVANKGPGNARTADQANVQRAVDQGGHQGMQGHQGQHSGGMGGEHGGDLHDVGSAQSGMTGGAGMGGNDTGMEQLDAGNEQRTDEADDPPVAEVQQSAQREGMGNHRHNSRGNQQAEDASVDMDDLGTHAPAAATSRK